MRLFGSRARGEGHEESDLDVLCLVESLTGAERLEVGQATGDLFTRYDVSVSALAMDTAHWALLTSLERRLPREVERDGVELLGAAT